MGFTTADRVQETSITTGTGTLTLTGAVVGYRTFADIGDTNTCHYAITAVNGIGNPTGDWEVGFGTYTAAGTTLSRTVVFSNSLGTTALISFAAGTKRVINTSTALDGRLVGCKLRLAVAKPIANITYDNVLFEAADHELWDTDGFHEGVTNPARITIPTGFDGTYTFRALVSWASNATGSRLAIIELYNSSDTLLDRSERTRLGNPFGITSQMTPLIAEVVGGDYAVVDVYQASNNPLNINGSATTGDGTTFDCTRTGN